MAIDINKIKVFGKFLDPNSGKKPTTGKKCLILIRSDDESVDKSVLKRSLTCTVDGPNNKPEVLWSTAIAEPDIDERTIVGYFVPTKPGKHKLTVKCQGKKLSGSPYEYDVAGECLDISKLLEKVIVMGRGYELGKAFTYNQFVVDCSMVQPPLGNLKVHVKGPERAAANLSIIDNENGTFTIRYKPTSPGTYIIQVKIAETDIPGSPFQVRVTEFLSS
ncbi:filamin-A [Dermatophagoides farinae]